MKASLLHLVKHCKLNYNYLSAFINNNREILDPRRSKARISSALYIPQVLDILNITSKKLVEARLIAKCIVCFRLAKKLVFQKKKLKLKLLLYNRYRLIRSSFTIFCEIRLALI